MRWEFSQNVFFFNNNYERCKFYQKIQKIDIENEKSILTIDLIQFVNVQFRKRIQKRKTEFLYDLIEKP